MLSRGFFNGEFEERISVGRCPCRAAESDELVKLNLNLDPGFAAPDRFIALLAMELEPFVIGVGQVRAGSPA
jgi:hypothetical protein